MGGAKTYIEVKAIQLYYIKKLPLRGSWRAEGETEGLNRTFYTISIKSLNSQFATTPANRPLIVWYSMALAVKRVLCSSSIMDTCVLR